MPSSSGTWRFSAIAAPSALPSSGEISSARSRCAIVVRTIPPSRSWSSDSSMSAASRDAPRRSRPSVAPLGLASQRPAAPATSSRRIRRATTPGIRKLSRRKLASVSPIRSLLRGTIAVCGMGRPSGWRNRAVTANQSASPPTIAASAKARTKPQAGCRSPSARATRNTTAIANSNAVATIRIRRSAGGVAVEPGMGKRASLMPRTIAQSGEGSSPFPRSGHSAGCGP